MSYIPLNDCRLLDMLSVILSTISINSLSTFIDSSRGERKLNSEPRLEIN